VTAVLFKILWHINSSFTKEKATALEILFFLFEEISLLLYRAFRTAIQSAHQLMHIHKIFTLKRLK
jgi:hypothetical protein